MKAAFCLWMKKCFSQLSSGSTNLIGSSQNESNNLDRSPFQEKKTLYGENFIYIIIKNRICDLILKIMLSRIELTILSEYICSLSRSENVC